MTRNRFASLIILVLFALPIFAQNGQSGPRFHGGLSLEAVVPVNEPLSNLYNFGYAANLRTKFDVSVRWKLTGSAGILTFSERRHEDEYLVYRVPAMNALPVRLGLMFHATPLVHVQVETGKAFFIGRGKGNVYIINPAVGLNYRNFDISIKYEHWLDASVMQFAGLRIGYYF